MSTLNQRNIELIVDADDTFLTGHAATVYLKLGGKTHRIGSFGVLHPTVLKNFELP